MSAAKESGVISGPEKEIAKKCIDVSSLILSGKRGNDEPAMKSLDLALQGFVDDVPFDVNVLKPKTFGQFLTLSKPTQAMFNQLASEIKWWDLLDQIEGVCFLQSPQIERAQPFITDLWKDEVAKNPFYPPTDWKYLPIVEAVEAYRKLFGSSLKADSVFKLAKQVNLRQDSEGIPIWPKLSFLAKHFGVSGNPLEDTEKGCEAYARIVELLIPEVGKAYTKAYPQFSFKNLREGQLTADHIQLTPAGRKTWQMLEKMSDDDFVIAPAEANTGSVYAGHSVRRSRVRIVLTGNRFPQDCVMGGSTLVIQPERVTKFKHLGIDCPGTKYAIGAGGGLRFSVSFSWHDGGLHFDYCWADFALQDFGSASGSR